MDKDLTRGNPLSLILALSIPQILSAVLQLLYNTVDAIIVGNYVGEAGLAGVGISMPVTFFLNSIIIGLSAGVSIIVGQYYGAKEYDNMRKTIGTSILALSIVTIIVSFVGVFGTNFILRTINTPEEVIPHASAYLSIYFTGTIFTLLYNLYSAILRAVGDAKSPLLFLAIAASLNVVLDLLFVIRFDMGTGGAALATIISQGVSSLFCIIYIKRKSPLLFLSRNEYKFNKYYFKQVLRFGLPSAVQMSIISLGNVTIQNLVNTYGVASIAGYSSAIRIDSFVVMPYMNVGIALANFTGQNMGAKKYDRVEEGLKNAFKLLVGISILTLPIVWLFSESLVGIFLDNPLGESVRLGSTMLRNLVPFYIFLGLLNNTSGLLRGSGDNMFSLYGSLVSIGIRIIFAYLFNSLMGISSVWYGAAIGWIIAFIFVILRVKSGKWQEKGIKSRS